MPLITVKCLNDGKPVNITKDDITLGGMKALMRSEILAKEEWDGKENGDLLAVMDAILPLMLKVAIRHDASWRGRSVEDLEDSLSIQEMKVFMEAVALVMPEAVKEQDASPPLA